MTEAKQKAKPQPSNWFRKTVGGGFPMRAALATLQLLFVIAGLAATDEGKFRVYDATAKKEIALPSGEVRLHTEFVPQGEYVLVRGELENLRGDERGFIVDYRLPLLSADAFFSNGLEESVPWPQ